MNPTRKNLKLIVLFLLVIQSNMSYSHWFSWLTNWFSSYKPAGVAAVETAAKSVNAIANEHLPVATNALKIAGTDVKEASENFGKKFGHDTTKYVFEKFEGYASKAGVAIVAVATSPVTTFAAGAAIGVYAGDKLYRYNNPSSYEILLQEQAKLTAAKAKLEALYASQQKEAVLCEKELRESLLKNINSSKNAAGIPIVCQPTICKCALFAGRERTHRILNNFLQHASQIQSKL